ncbi:uncharacterized protein B0I36DRAFT_376564 [Microdochium trichocladiopsis]|uniref:chitinase n=1 Tax=Microdochium trichocladiopsis TaxID=1682393 RepID=A0A9P8Y0P1_9PEZI|nr:uncharacterized protein B0I36DRAFT_376564 [Microdochium trichocladiopsis]KAH7024682.1 hypothetical protein B0I36DRAFT_376564 [Microdochium trichocladiopsis]
MHRKLGLAAALWSALPSTQAQELSSIDVFNQPADPNTFYSDQHACPRACGDLPADEWDVFSSFQRLRVCDEPMIFQLGLYAGINSEDEATPLKVRVCTTGDETSQVNALFEPIITPPEVLEAAAANILAALAEPEIDDTVGNLQERQTQQEGTAQCVVGDPAQTSLHLSRTGEGSAQGAQAILDSLAKYFGNTKSCERVALFGYHKGTVAGLYAGNGLNKATSVGAIIKAVSGAGEVPQHVSAEVCGTGRNANHVLGLVVDGTGDLAAVQKTVRDWNEAKCLSQDDTSAATSGNGVDIEIAELPIPKVITGDLASNSTGIANGTALAGSFSAGIKRADCRIERVISGDSCGSLAARCGISSNDFTKYNSAKDLCSTLKPGQPVCCSSGSLPDLKPKPQSDGTCYTHYVIENDNCSNLGAMYTLTNDDIEGFNKGVNGTWGWTGCKNLKFGMNMCLSKGKPPMPAPVSNAVCGPTKPDTEKPSSGQNLADLNPCPLNVCCNIWGQCGISNDFCLEKRGESGNPGTSPEGTNGCVSSCGSEIKKDGTSPASFGRIGYFESWNWNRNCLNMRAARANTDGTYTHIHWAFSDIDQSNWTVKKNDTNGQWTEFKNLRGVKKIISFGGWAFSNEAPTYDILRQAMNPSNRETFANNVVKFLKDEGLDGVDFDWEYPGAPDTDFPGLPSDGPNYLKFLQLIKGKLGGKSLSIAAPASYWYLKQFPIKEMAKFLDYIVYMTYDLHGQWDAGNKWSSDGCPDGNCLRSHINMTETTQVLAMITKAGVSPSKIFVGESSYGRSFRMAKAGCDGPMCKYTGDRLNSEAAPGRCTNTSGYISNAEIENIRQTYGDVKSWHDARSNSDLMVYDKVEWVAYMSDTTKNTRREHWKGFGFAGTIDWAVDLQKFTGDTLEPLNDENEAGVKPLEKCSDVGKYNKLEDIEKNVGSIPLHCRSAHMLNAMQKILSDSLSGYDKLLAGGYDESFKTYADVVVDGSKTAVEDFMYENGKDYFTCKVTETIDSCDHCNTYDPGDNYCRYCEDYDCGWSSICDQPEVLCGDHENRYRDIDMPCLPDYSMRAGGKPSTRYWPQTTQWKLRSDKENEFYGALYKSVGIDKENIRWTDVHHWECTPADSKEICRKRNWDINFPVPSGYDREDVLDPKDVVEGARKNLTEIGPSMTNVLDKVKAKTFRGNLDDIVDAMVVPIVMVEDAVAQMGKVKELADKIDAQKREMIIMAFLSAIFFFVPVMGAVVGAFTSLANVARIMALIGSLGGAGMDIYDIVKSDGNDFLAIFGLVLAPFDIISVAKITKAANIRRGMKADDIKALGDVPKARMDTIERIRGNGACKAKGARDLTFDDLSMSGLDGREYGFVLSPVPFKG